MATQEDYERAARFYKRLANSELNPVTKEEYLRKMREAERMADEKAGAD